MKNDIALVGLGYLGKIHLKLLKENPNWNLTGVFDIDKKLTSNLANQYQIKAFDSLEQLIESSGAIDIVTPSNTHFEIAQKAIMAGKHVFIEKPVTSTLKEAKRLQELINETGTCFQVGHVE